MLFERVERRNTRGCMAEQIGDVTYGRIVALAPCSLVLKHCRGVAWRIHWTRFRYFSNGFAPDEDKKMDRYEWMPADAFHRHDDGILRWDS